MSSMSGQLSAMKLLCLSHTITSLSFTVLTRTSVSCEPLACAWQIRRYNSNPPWNKRCS